MTKVWLRARHDFTFAGQSYTTGQVFSAEPLVAVQLKARRSVDLTKQPAPAAPAAVKSVQPIVTTRRRSIVVPKAPVEPVHAEPDAPTAEVPAVEPSSDMVDANTGTYARKDLRADGE